MEEKSGFGYFLLGLGIGVAAGLLWAPRSGEETRQLLADRAGEGADYLRNRAQEGQEYMRQRSDDLKQSATDIYEKGRTTVSRHKETLNAAVEAGKQAYRDALAVQPGNANTMTVSGFTVLSGMQNLVVSNGPIAGSPFQVQVGVANPQVSAATARRFLQQAAFGPSPNDAAHVQQVGLQGWLTEQFNTPKVSNYQNMGSQGGLGTRLLTNAVSRTSYGKE